MEKVRTLTGVNQKARLLKISELREITGTSKQQMLDRRTTNMHNEGSTNPTTRLDEEMEVLYKVLSKLNITITSDSTPKEILFAESILQIYQVIRILKQEVVDLRIVTKSLDEISVQGEL